MKCTTDKSCHTSRCIKIGLMIVAGIGALTWVVMQLWNALLPDLFTGVAHIGYWQALGVLLLSRILFGGLRGGCGSHWRERRERWANMTPEEREALKGRFGHRWAHCCTPKTAPTAATGDDSTDHAARP